MKNFIVLLLIFISISARASDITADKRLYLGIIENNIGYVEQAINDGAYLNKKYNQDYTPLSLACTINSKPIIIKKLINAGADFRFENSKKENLLAIALNQSANAKTIQMLINYGLNPNDKNNKGKTALYTGLIHKAPYEAIVALLQNGANTNIPFEYKGNPVYPLTLAVLLESPREIIKVLIKYSNQDAQFQALTAAITINDTKTYQLFKDSGLLKEQHNTIHDDTDGD